MNRLLALFAFMAAFGLPNVYAQEVGDSDSAQSVVISTGTEGGGYWNAGDRLRAVAKKLGMSIENLPSKGSRENIERLMNADSPVGLAFVQADAAQHYLNQHPDALEQAQVLENIGQECVFIIAGANSSINTLDDLADSGSDITLGISSEDSGMAATFHFMASIDEKLESIAIKYGNTQAAMEALGETSREVDAIMLVHRPKAHSPEVDMAIANPNNFKFVDLKDSDLNAQLSNGEDVYRQMRLALPGLEEPISTVCVKGLLLGHKSKLGVDQLNIMSEITNFHWMKVYVTP